MFIVVTRFHKIRAMWLNQCYWARARPSNPNCCQHAMAQISFFSNFSFATYIAIQTSTSDFEIAVAKVGRGNGEHVPRLRRNRMIACFTRFLFHHVYFMLHIRCRWIFLTDIIRSIFIRQNSGSCRRIPYA